MKKIILMGETGSGKTTLTQCLHDKEQVYHKTQQIYQFDHVIDTPGEFMENRFFYNALVSAAVEAEVVGLIQSVEHEQNYFPPTFSSRFNLPVVGIVTKTELAHDKKDLERSKIFLEQAGARQIFMISAKTGEGMADLLTYLEA